MEIQNVNGVLTMSSLEIVSYINSTRKEGEAELRHASFLEKVPKVLNGDEQKFLSIYLDAMNRQKPCYKFPKRESILMAMSYSYELQAQIFDAWQEAEEKLVLPKVQPQTITLDPVIRSSQIAEATFKTLCTFGIDRNSAIISASQVGFTHTGINIYKDAQLSLEAPNQKYIPLTVTELGKLKNTSAVKMNKMLELAGLQVKVDEVWKPTDKASKYVKVLDTGKKHTNGTPITQMKWYEDVLSAIEN